MRLLLLATLFVLPSLSAETFDLPEREPRAPALFEIERGAMAPDGMHELGDISFGGSAGLGFSPLGFLLTSEADFWLFSFFSVGPTLEVLLADDIIVGLAASPKFTFDFGHEFSELVKPYVHLGPGVAIVNGYNDRDRRRTEIGLLILLGFGVDFYIWENVSLGTGVLFNFLPTEPVDQRFFFGWKIIEAKVHF